MFNKRGILFFDQLNNCGNERYVYIGNNIIWSIRSQVEQYSNTNYFRIGPLHCHGHVQYRYGIHSDPVNIIFKFQWFCVEPFFKDDGIMTTANVLLTAGTNIDILLYFMMSWVSLLTPSMQAAQKYSRGQQWRQFFVFFTVTQKHMWLVANPVRPHSLI